MKAEHLDARWRCAYRAYVSARSSVARVRLCKGAQLQVSGRVVRPSNVHTYARRP
ncbi:hypothetical protein KCP69_20295 [Salmonella enterica subsp. enterica]|nr:hypothetical protein KCP69_20295 [Salmonella enterica subsp. enterica]